MRLAAAQSPPVRTAIADAVDAGRLYLSLVGARVRAQMQYRWSFVADVAASFVAMITEFVAVLILYLHTPSLGGWTLPEVAFLYGTADLSFSGAKILCAGFDELPEQVRTGEFDRILIRPRSTFLQVLGAEFTLRHAGRMLQAALVLVAALVWLEPGWAPGQWAFLAWTLGGGVLFFAGLLIAGGTFSFWTIESLEAMNVFTYGGSEMARFPISIYGPSLRRFFTFIVPLAFVNYVPALLLLGKSDPHGLPTSLAYLAVPACAAVLGVSIAFWHAGVRRYHSTGH